MGGLDSGELGYGKTGQGEIPFIRHWFWDGTCWDFSNVTGRQFCYYIYGSRHKNYIVAASVISAVFIIFGTHNYLFRLCKNTTIVTGGSITSVRMFRKTLYNWRRLPIAGWKKIFRKTKGYYLMEICLPFLTNHWVWRKKALTFLYAYMPIGDLTDYEGDLYLRSVTFHL